MRLEIGLADRGSQPRASWCLGRWYANGLAGGLVGGLVGRHAGGLAGGPAGRLPGGGSGRVLPRHLLARHHRRQARGRRLGGGIGRASRSVRLPRHLLVTTLQLRSPQSTDRTVLATAPRHSLHLLLNLSNM